MSDTEPTPAGEGAAASRRPCRRHSAEECFANMAMLWRHHGRPPQGRDANRAPSTVGKDAYTRRAGTWRRAVAAFAQFSGIELKRIGPEAPDAPATAGARQGRGEPRSIPLSLRFQVLQRDRF
ncbi:MAG: hypothetical protein ACT4N4_17545, partial [Rhodospirillales bacterium]